MSTGTATLVIKQAMNGDFKDSTQIKDLNDTGRYYTARITNADGTLIHRMLIDKQNGNVQFIK